MERNPVIFIEKMVDNSVIFIEKMVDNYGKLYQHGRNEHKFM